MSRFASGVVVATTRDSGTSDWGMTLTAVALLSLDPPLVLACLATDAGSTAAFTGSERFALSVLGAEHEDLALRFATGRPDKFVLGGFERTPAGLPVVAGALAVLECRTRESIPGGDHVIVIGAVERAQSRPGDALIHHGGEFGALSALSD